MDFKQDQSVAATVEQVIVRTRETLEYLTQSWKTLLEFDDDLKDVYHKNFVEHVENFYKDMVESEKRREEYYVDCINGLKEEKTNLEEELNVCIDVDENFLKSRPLKTQNDMLNESLKVYRIMKIERMERLNSLINQEMELCKRLGEQRMNISHTKVPFKRDLDYFEEHIKDLENEKDCRLKVYHEVKNHLRETLESLELNADSTLEEEVLFGEKDQLLLTTDRMAELQELKRSLLKKVEFAKNESQKLISELMYIWHRNDESKEFQERFLETHQNHFGKKTLEKLHNEIARSKAILKDNLEAIIRKVRTEIINLGTKLTFTQVQIQEITAFNNDDFTEANLELHEKEVHRLKIMITDTKEILELAEKRRQLWERMIEIEESTNDKNRLFNNRGGQLLKEEKERKCIDNNLPKIERQLSTLLKQYEEQKGSVFLWFGENLLTKIATDWQCFNSARESRKMKVATSKSTLLVPPSKTRKLLQNDKVGGINSKKFKTDAESNSPLVLNSTVILSKGCGSGVVCRTPSGVQQRKEDISCSSVGSYSDFQERLQTSPRPPLLEVNAVSHSSPRDVKTPRRTPGPDETRE